MRSSGYLLKEGFRSLWNNRTMTLASVAVLISCLLLTGVAVALSLNIDNTMRSIEESNRISVYIEPEASPLTSIQIGEQIKSMPNVDTWEYIPKDDGLLDLMDILDESGDGTSSVLIGLEGENNFLPDAYRISLKDLSLYDETIASITAIEGVRSITDYSEVAEDLSSLDQLITYGSIALVLVLAIVSLFIISNTVKVTMFSRRVEISIMKSVGATNWFVRVPFIVEGMLIGILSGAISAFVLLFSYDQLTEMVYNVVQFISIIDIKPYTYYIYAVYIVLGSLFGIMGGVISIGRYLKREGENAAL